MKVNKKKLSSIVMNNSDQNRIKNMESIILSSKMEIANIELQIAELIKRKNNLIDVTNNKTQEMFEDIRSIALSYGIDVDGADGKKWNLDTSKMIFQEIK